MSASNETTAAAEPEATYTLISDGLESLIAAAPVSEEKFQITRIFQGTGARQIRLTFAQGQIMREHSTNAPLIVQILEGEIAFRISGDEIVMPKGAIIHVEPGVKHELEAHSDAHVLLTLSI